MDVEKEQKEQRWPRIIILTLLFFCLTLTGIYCFIQFFAMSANTELAPRPGPMYQLDPFYVNLAGERNRAILKAVVVLELIDSTGEEEVELHQPVLRDEIISILRCNSISQLQEQDNYEQLKQEIKHKVNSILPGKGITSVYFIEFLISN